MRNLTAKNGEQIIVDDEDYGPLALFRWRVDHLGYVVRESGIKNKPIRLHRFLLGHPKNQVVDHINGNTLDNRKSNLRACSTKENVRNSKTPKNNTSGYKGVTWKPSKNKYRAFIKVDRKQIHLGYFDDPQKAHEAYKVAAVEHHGEFARFE